MDSSSVERHLIRFTSCCWWAGGGGGRVMVGGGGGEGGRVIGTFFIHFL